jgi:hypothetical protein
MSQHEGPHYKYLGVEFWAVRGLITVVDVEKAGDSKVLAPDCIQRISPGELIKRAVAVRMSINDKYPSMVRSAHQFMDRAVAAAKLAKAQGDPTDPKVLEHFGKHRRRSSVSTLVLPGDLPPIGGRSFQLKLGKPRDILLGGVQVTPDQIIRPGRMLTPAMANRLRKPKFSGRGR